MKNALRRTAGRRFDECGAAFRQALAGDPLSPLLYGFAVGLHAAALSRSSYSAAASASVKRCTDDPENAYFADGVTEDLITELAKVPALKVVSLTSVMRFRAGDRNVSAIARAYMARVDRSCSETFATSRDSAR